LNGAQRLNDLNGLNVAILVERLERSLLSATRG
jgi:hypothetical protein